MFSYKLLLFTVIWLCFAQNLQAQHHQNAWFRSTISVQIKPKIELEAEFQHRRQSGFESVNRLGENLMFSYRSWIHYPLNKDVKVSLSPFAYFVNYKIIEQPLDAVTESKSEIRFSAAIALQHELFSNFFINHRSATEYRVFENSANITRLRNRLGLRYDVNEKLKLGLYDELLFNIHGTTTSHFLDHNRIGLSITYQLLSDLKVETGYMQISRLPIASENKLQESNLLLHFTYQVHLN